MGTRSLTVFVDEHNKEICVLYRQFDGYPEGHGRELAEFLAGFNVVNGFGMDMPKKSANGAGCLAAQAIAHFKTEIGQFYLYPGGTRDTGEEYTYFVKPSVGKEPVIQVFENIWPDEKYSGDEVKPDTLNLLYEGPASEVLAALPT